tara:strand:- start:123 stop:686 length:564 start_codon:yes stop_codon:yes gene_type:complete
MDLHTGPELVERILGQYALHPFGIHGVGHWARVLLNGRLLAEETGADPRVVELFALFHDSRRINDGTDPEHGARGAELAATQRGDWFQLDDAGMEQLRDACALHSEGLVEHPDVTVRTCWDADRLDLSRVGIRPRPDRLATAPARRREVIELAVARGHERFLPHFVAEVWGLELPVFRRRQARYPVP